MGQAILKRPKYHPKIMADSISTSAPNLERQAIEVLFALREQERLYNAEVPTRTPLENVSISIDPATRSIYVSARIDADFQFENGQIVIRGVESIPSVGT